MKIIKTLTVTLALSLCAGTQAAGPTGAMAGGGESTSTGRSATNTQLRELAVTRESVATFDMPALPLAISAVRERGGIISEHAQAATWPDCKDTKMMKGWQRLLNDEKLADSKDGMLLVYGNCATLLALSVSQPLSGWPVNAMRNSPELRAYMDRSLAAAIANNEILTPIVAKFAKQPGLTAKKLVEEMSYAFHDSLEDWMIVYLKEVEKRRGYTKDLTGQGPAPVHFTTTDGWDYQHGPAGALLTYNGVAWYGQGHLMGKKYTFQVASRRSARMVRSSDTKAARSASTAQGTEAGAATPQQ